MKTVTLPGSSVEIPALALGMSGMGTAEHHDRAYVEKRIGTLRHAVERGLAFVDTAALYGNGFSEIITGEALKTVRRRCFIATKFFPYAHYRRQDVIEAVESSLRRLGTGHIDLIQLHWPNPRADYDEVLGTLEELVAAGVVRFIGASNFCADEIADCNSRLRRACIATNQYEFNLLTQSILPDMRRAAPGTLLLAYSALNQGRLYASAAQRDVIGEIARSRGTDDAQVILAWVLGHSVAATVKVSSVAHVESLLGAMDLVLTDEERARIDAVRHIAVTPLPLGTIRLVGTEWRAPYRTLQEAVDNPLDLIPSPVELAERIGRGALAMPLKVRRDPDGGYVLDPYDPFDGVKKYWAWVIARGHEDIPAHVID